MQSTNVGVSHESATNVNEPKAMDRTENIDKKSDCEHDIAEETQFLTPKSNVSFQCFVLWLSLKRSRAIIKVI